MNKLKITILPIIGLGLLAPDTLAFDGFSTTVDGSWDKIKPRIKRN